MVKFDDKYQIWQLQSLRQITNILYIGQLTYISWLIELSVTTIQTK